MNGRRIARWGVALLIGVPIPIATLLMLTIYTETGSRWVLAQALRSAPGVMQIGGFRGRLMDQFELIDVDVKATVVSARIDSVSIRWRPLALFKGEFIVESTALDGVDLTFKSRTSESEAPTPSALPAPPLPLEVQRLDLRNIRIHLAGQEFIVDHLGLRAEWSTARLALNGFEVKAYGHRFGAAGSVAVGHRPKVAVSADWAGAIGGEQGTASLEIKGPLNELAFETTIEAHASGRLSGSINPLADVPKLSLQGNIAALDLGDNMTLGETRVDIVGSLESLVVSIAADASTVQTGAYALSLDTEIALIGATDDTITAEINWQAKPTRAGSEDLVGSGRLRYDGKAVRIDHATAAPYRTRVAGTVELGSDEPMLDLELGWNDIKYSLSDGQEVIARDGTALFEGPLKNINIELVSAFDVSPMGPVELTGNFRSNEQRLFVQQLTVALLQGQVQTVGKINFTEGVEGDFEFSGSDLDFSALNAETPSRLGFSGSAHFNSATNGITSQVELSTLTGYLRGHALSGAALVHTRPRALTIDHMHLNAGSNRIDLRGNWGEQMNGEFDLQLDELAVLDQRLTGTIAGHGTFSGNPTLPQIKAQFTGSALRFDRFAAGSLNADIDYDMLREAESNVDFNIDEISIDGKAFGELTFAGRGNSQAHALQLVLDGEPLTLQATASGTFGEHDWQGRVSGLETDSDIAGAWSLVAPVEIALAKDAASFTDACLASGAARACISGNHRTAGSSARIRLAALPLALADHFMPATLRLRGATNGTIDLVATNGVITGTGNVRLSNGIIERDRGDGEPDKLQIRTFTVDFDVLPDSIRAEANADVEQWFTLHGTVSAERTRGGVVSAAIDAQADDIGWIAEFVPELSGSTGTLALTSALSGTIDHPQGSANLKLSQGALQVPDMGLSLTGLETTLVGDLNSLNVHAAIGAGEGSLALNGKLFIDDEQPRYDLNLTGSNFPLVRIPEAEVDVSPELQLVGNAKSIEITGAVLVPRILVDVKRLPNSAVSVSEDQVMVGGNGSAGEAQRNDSFLTDKVSGDVAIRLGDDISINGFGITSKLSGGLQWTKQLGHALGRANGAIKIDNGVFKAYGQNMVIENGRLEFAGPIGNPGLAIQAVRPDIPVKAGINVTGTVRTPEISLFSSPPLTDGNTLSYIVTGREIGEASAGDAGVLTQAALSLGVEQSTVVRNQIRNIFGLDELSVAAGETARDTSLVAGKRLSPKLSVRTGFNPFDQLWSFFLNYKLTPRWSIEAESGERQGADLLYSIEGERLLDVLRLD